MESHKQSFKPRRADAPNIPGKSPKRDMENDGVLKEVGRDIQVTTVPPSVAKTKGQAMDTKGELRDSGKPRSTSKSKTKVSKKKMKSIKGAEYLVLSRESIRHILLMHESWGIDFSKLEKKDQKEEVVEKCLNMLVADGARTHRQDIHRNNKKVFGLIASAAKDIDQCINTACFKRSSSNNQMTKKQFLEFTFAVLDMKEKGHLVRHATDLKWKSFSDLLKVNGCFYLKDIVTALEFLDSEESIVNNEDGSTLAEGPPRMGEQDKEEGMDTMNRPFNYQDDTKSLPQNEHKGRVSNNDNCDKAFCSRMDQEHVSKCSVTRSNAVENEQVKPLQDRADDAKNNKEEGTRHNEDNPSGITTSESKAIDQASLCERCQLIVKQYGLCKTTTLKNKKETSDVADTAKNSADRDNSDSKTDAFSDNVARAHGNSARNASDNDSCPNKALNTKEQQSPYGMGAGVWDMEEAVKKALAFTAEVKNLLFHTNQISKLPHMTDKDMQRLAEEYFDLSQVSLPAVLQVMKHLQDNPCPGIEETPGSSNRSKNEEHANHAKIQSAGKKGITKTWHSSSTGKDSNNDQDANKKVKSFACSASMGMDGVTEPLLGKKIGRNDSSNEDSDNEVIITKVVPPDPPRPAVPVPDDVLVADMDSENVCGAHKGADIDDDESVDGKTRDMTKKSNQELRKKYRQAQESMHTFLAEVSILLGEPTILKLASISKQHMDTTHFQHLAEDQLGIVQAMRDLPDIVGVIGNSSAASSTNRKRKYEECCDNEAINPNKGNSDGSRKSNEDEIRSQGGQQSHSHKVLSKEDPDRLYKVLGVPRTASRDEIRDVSRRLIRRCHPDKSKGEKNATAKTQKLNEAREVLCDPTKRLYYDLTARIPSPADADEMKKFSNLAFSSLIDRFKFRSIFCLQNINKDELTNMVPNEAYDIMYPLYRDITWQEVDCLAEERIDVNIGNFIIPRAPLDTMLRLGPRMMPGIHDTFSILHVLDGAENHLKFYKGNNKEFFTLLSPRNVVLIRPDEPFGFVNLSKKCDFHISIVELKDHGPEYEDYYGPE